MIMNNLAAPPPIDALFAALPFEGLPGKKQWENPLQVSTTFSLLLEPNLTFGAATLKISMTRKREKKWRLFWACSTTKWSNGSVAPSTLTRNLQEWGRVDLWRKIISSTPLAADTIQRRSDTTSYTNSIQRNWGGLPSLRVSTYQRKLHCQKLVASQSSSTENYASLVVVVYVVMKVMFNVALLSMWTGSTKKKDTQMNFTYTTLQVSFFGRLWCKRLWYNTYIFVFPTLHDEPM